MRCHQIESLFVEAASPDETDLLFAALDPLPAPIAVLDDAGIIQFANCAFAAFTGYSNDEAAGHSITLLSCGASNAHFFEIVRDVTSTRRPWNGVCLWRTKFGTSFTVEQTVTPVKNGRNGIRYALLTVAETERQVAEAKRDFDRFFDLIPDLACIVSTDGYFKKVNAAWETTLGYTEDEVLRTPMLDFIHPDDLEATLNEISRQSPAYRTKHFVNRYRCKDGSYRLLDWTTTFNRDESTRFGVARDITEQRKWEESLVESEERFRIMADSCPTIIWVTDAQGKIRMTNRMCREFFGATFEQGLEREQLRTMLHPEDQSDYIDKFRAALQKREPFHAEARVRRSDGEWRWTVSYAEPRLSLSGDFLGYVGISPDITDRKNSEVALQRAKEAAEIANRAKSEFLANMSHEIRTPMNGVIGLTDLALDTDLTAEQRGYLQDVKISAESLLRILNDILDFSKIEAGKLEFEAIEFDLRPSVMSVLKVVGARAAEKKLELACDFDPRVPARVIGDPGRLQQILMNLTGNAIKFTESGEVIVAVDVLQNIAGAVQLHFSVKDTGIGIPADKHQQVFSPFTQADTSSTRKFGGTGLGLSISSQLIEMMGGRIWLESKEGIGSTFHFSVRLAKATPRGHEKRPAVEALKGQSVLVVDDSESNRRILEKILVSAGLKPVLADSGYTALEALKRANNRGESFKHIVADTQMPGTDALEFLEALRFNERFASANVVLLSPAIQRGDAARYRDLSVSAHLIKPVGETELLEALAESQESGALGILQEPPRRENGVRLHVLVVEDNPVNRTVATRLLTNRHHTVRTAENGKEALDLVHRERFDCVLMDVQMPVLDGFETTAAIRARERHSGRHLPIIAMTAHAMTGDLERCLAAGMDGYLTKPIKAEDVLAALQRVTRPFGQATPGPLQTPAHASE